MFEGWDSKQRCHWQSLDRDHSSPHKKKSLSNFFPLSCNTCQSRAGYISGAFSRPLCYLLVLILCILLVVLSPTPTPRLLPTSQWSVVSVSFHWCVGSNLVNPPAPISLKQTNTGHINLTAADSTTGGVNLSPWKLWQLTQHRRTANTSLRFRSYFDMQMKGFIGFRPRCSLCCCLRSPRTRLGRC